MLFNSYIFWGFFPLFLAFYLIVQRSLIARNILILLASYVFYCWWDYRFGALLLFTSLTDFTFAQLIEKQSRTSRRNALLAGSLCINLGVLGFFKYFGFFSEGLQVLLNQIFGVHAQWHLLHIILPVGISFYTFQSMSYVIDVYRGKLAAARNPIQFLAFVSFFPQLVAGPIERAPHMLPQFSRTLHITVENLEHGIWLIIWGLFQKVVLADNLAPLVELAYDHAAPSLPILLLGTTAFALQIYCDFAGYSDMARGLAKLLGFELMINFNLPYLARSLGEFWQRWHISLSTWIRDYLYIPLGGNRLGESRTRVNLLIVMVLAGLWHGAAANFLLWGAWHGFGMVIYRTWERFRPANKLMPAALAWFLTMVFVWVGWVFFRCKSIDQIADFARSINCFTMPLWWQTYVKSLLFLAAPLVIMHAWQAHCQKTEAFLVFNRPTRAFVQGVMLLAIVSWWENSGTSFIYFQF